MCNTCRTTSVWPCDCSLSQYGNMPICISWNLDIPRSLNSRDSFPRTFENRAQISCRPGPILSLPTISFELHAKMADEIDLEKNKFSPIFGTSEAPWPWPWSWIGQGHTNMHNTCRTTSMPDHVTVASHSTETWPFEFREISTFHKVLTPMIAFLEGHSKIGLRHAVDWVPYYHYQPLLLSSTRKWRSR